MKISLFRTITAYIAFSFLVLVALPILLLSGGKVNAAGQIQSRSIQMSDDTTNTSGGTASYLVQFNVATTGNVQAVIVDFCNTDPIPGDACVIPTGFTSGNTFTPGTNTASGWTASTANSNRTFELQNSSGGSLASGTTVSFTITGVVNPTVEGTFYARILTFATPTLATTWITAAADGSSLGSFTDYGGIALSTTQTIVVTSKIQEQLSFCVYVTSCGTQATINLGDSHDVLSISAPYVDNTTTYSLSTNASHGAVIYLKGTTLTSGTNTIPPAGAAGTYLYNTTGTDFFGICSYNTSGMVPTVATTYTGTSNAGACSATVTDTGLTAVLSSLGTPYATFGFNSTNTTSTYGDLLATYAGPGASVDQVALAAGVNVTQPSGIYTTTLQLIATGTY